MLLSIDGAGSVAGWWSPGQPGHGAVLLLHGVRADRRAMLGRARLLRAQGYGVLLIDLPAHGESPGNRITFGLRESHAVVAALDWLRQQAAAGERIGVVGVSLGAASLILSAPMPAVDAVVLESMYPTLADAVQNRLVAVLGPAGRLLAPALLWQLPLRLGVDAGAWRPIDHIGQLAAPVLILSGTNDRHTTAAETERLFAAARAPRHLRLFEGAGHVDLQGFDPAGYAAVVQPFLARHLRSARSPSQ